MNQDTINNSTLDSQIRFFSVIWISYGVGFLVVISDINKHKFLFKYLTVFLFLSGFGRLASMLIVGIPSFPLVLATIVELILIPVVFIWHDKLLKKAPIEPSIPLTN